MVPTITQIGIFLLIVGLIGTLFGFYYVDINPFVGSTNKIDYDQKVESGNYFEPEDDLFRGEPIPFPGTYINIQIIVNGSEIFPYSFQLFLLCRSQDNPQGIVLAEKSYDLHSDPNPTTVSIGTFLPENSAGSSYLISFKIENTGQFSFTLQSVQGRTVQYLLGIIIWLTMVVVGLLSIIIGVITSMKVKKRKTQLSDRVFQTSEPVLDSQSHSKEKVPSKIVVDKPQIKSVKSPTGAQQQCKYCGKNIPAHSFYCQFCFEKL